MKIRDYTAQTHLTAKYPGSGTEDGLTYVSLGLIGETGEVAEHFKKALRDDGGVLTEERRMKLVGELGDVLWYWSEGRRCLGIGDSSLSPPHRSHRDVHQLVFRLSAAASGFAMTPEGRLGHLAMVFATVSGICAHIGVGIETVMQSNADKLRRRLEAGTLSGSGSDR
jgi:hypothetical protein